MVMANILTIRFILQNFQGKNWGGQQCSGVDIEHPSLHAIYSKVKLQLLLFIILSPSQSRPAPWAYETV